MWLSEPVQLLAVDLDGVVRCRRPEPIPPFGRARIRVGPGVEEERDAGERCVERRDVVVAVAAAARRARRDRSRRRRGPRPPAGSAQPPSAKSCGPGPPSRRAPAAARAPAARRPRRAGRPRVRRRPRLRPSSRRGSGGRRAAARRAAALVRRRRRPRQGTSRQAACRRRRSAPSPRAGRGTGRAPKIEPAPKQRRQQEQLGHESVVGRRHLEVDAVGRHLARSARRRAATSPRSPSAPEPRPLPKKRPAKTIPAASASRWFPLTSESSRFRATKSPCRYTARRQPEPEGGIAPRVAAAERVEEPRQREDPDRGLHRARPVDALPVRVRLDPLLERVADDLRVRSSPVEQVRLAGGEQPLQARDLPGDLHVARPVELRVLDGRATTPAAKLVPETTSVCQSAGRSSRNGPVPSRSRVRSAATSRTGLHALALARRDALELLGVDPRQQKRARAQTLPAGGKRVVAERRQQRPLVEPPGPRTARGTVRS